MKYIKKLIRLAFYFGFIVLFILAASDTLITECSRGLVYESPEEVSGKRVGLVLGTSYRLSNGHVNPYFKYRMQAAADLYHAGKLSAIIVSGDNSRTEYDEATDMKEMLVALGVPESVIYLDYAGFRTLDSVVRSKKVFGQNAITIVSQQFHNERAVFLARIYGMKAEAYSAKDLNNRLGLAVHVREKLARVKAVIDILTFKKPRFLGPKVDIKHA
ncbi:MAG: YdcF family protein [Bacteroidia bacterium]|nr:YdcF family protein [Bacteroidia bacterium]